MLWNQQIIRATQELKYQKSLDLCLIRHHRRPSRTWNTPLHVFLLLGGFFRVGVWVCEGQQFIQPKWQKQDWL